MKKVIFLILTINILTIASCCTDEHQITGTQSLEAFSLISNEQITAVSESFMLVARLEVELVSNEFHNPFVNELYGTSCDLNLINPIEDQTISLISDKDITLDGVTIAAGSNLIDLESVILDNNFESINILFDNDFISSATFPSTETYVFTLTLETTDGLVITDTISLDMQL